MGFYHPRRERDQIRKTALGVLDESEPVSTMYGTATSPTSQTVYGRLLGLRAGDVVTGVQIRLVVAALGTAPTTARFGIADAAGTVLAVSGNVGSAAVWAIGPNRHALTAPYTILADGGYFACFVVNGTWGTTQPTIKAGSGSSAGAQAVAGFAPTGFTWATQTDLPAVASPLTITTPSFLYYMAAY